MVQHQLAPFRAPHKVKAARNLMGILPDRYGAALAEPEKTA
jgi:hypothetical protein